MTVTRRTRARSFRPFAALLVAALTACSHGEPFTAPDSDLDVPFAESEPVRLTYADGPETDPAWLPDGSAFVYSYDRLGTAEGDRCLATLPATGGTIEREVCNASPLDEFIADVYATPSMLPDSTLAFFYAAAAGQGVPSVAGVFVSSYENPDAKRLIRALPFTGPTGNLYAGVASVRWVGPESIAFIGLLETTVLPCSTCDAIVVRYGRDVLVAGASGPSSLAVVPGIGFPTSLSAGEFTEVIYYTLAGDTRIYRRVLATGATSTVYDFGPGGIVRDIHYSAGRIAAIVGGNVTTFADPAGAFQQDGEGRLFLVTVATATAQFIAGSPFDIQYQNPALSPDGSSIVAEGYGPASPGGNLWLFRNR